MFEKITEIYLLFLSVYYIEMIRVVEIFYRENKGALSYIDNRQEAKASIVIVLRYSPGIFRFQRQKGSSPAG